MRKVFAVFAFPVIALLFSFDTSAQSRSISSRTHPTAATRNAVVATELDRQRLFLQNVTSRYEAKSATEFTPYLSYTYIWKALKENRDHLSRQRHALTIDEFAAVKKGYEMLEHDVLMQFVDLQVSVFSDELELNSIQTEEMEKVLIQDLNQKKTLLAATGLSPDIFEQRVAALSDATEKRILARLFPEQRSRFNEQIQFSRNRMVG